MSVFGKIWHVFAAIGVGLKDVLEYAPKLVSKFEKLVVAEKSAKSEFVQSGGVLLADVTTFLAAAAIAAKADCLKWNEDMEAVKAAEKILADAPAFIQAIEDGFKAIKKATA